MLSRKLNNLLKLYKVASRESNLATINHCSQQLKKMTMQVRGRKLDPISQHYLQCLYQIHNQCPLNIDDQIGVSSGESDDLRERENGQLRDEMLASNNTSTAV